MNRIEEKITKDTKTKLFTEGAKTEFFYRR
jgi:hypothetical protein